MSRRGRRKNGNVRLMSLVLAVLLGLTLGVWVVDRYGGRANARLRMDRVEQQVRRLQTLLAGAQSTAAASARPKFFATCPEPWNVVGPIAGGLWGCQAPAPEVNDFHANCNVTRSRVAAGADPEHYYNSAVAASPQLSAAKPLGGRALMLHGRAAYQASFEHRLLGPPMRVMATVFVEGERAYAVTCTAPAPSFEAYAAQFREIAGSFELSS
jgi:hypothetical protein